MRWVQLFSSSRRHRTFAYTAGAALLLCSRASYCQEVSEVHVLRSDFIDAARFGLETASRSQDLLAKQGHLGNLQPLSILVALVYALRNARVALTLDEASPQIETGWNRLLEREEALLERFHANQLNMHDFVDATGFLQAEFVSVFDVRNSDSQARRSGRFGLSTKQSSHRTDGPLLNSIKVTKTQSLGSESRQMPTMGLGTGIFYKQPSEVQEIIRQAAAMFGYRYFDCGQAYHNEDVVGRGLHMSGVPREELFIASKLSERTSYGSIETVATVQKQLGALQTSYLDLYMFHGDMGDHEKEREAWQALEALQEAGTIRDLGFRLSNSLVAARSFESCKSTCHIVF